MLAAAVVGVCCVVGWLLARNHKLPLRNREPSRLDDGGTPLRLFGHLRWRTPFELQNVIVPIMAGDEYGLGEEQFEPSDVIIDVGAHIGVFATVCHRRGSRAIHCYEPDPSNFQLLESNVAGLPGVHLVEAAVWRSDVVIENELLLSGPDGDNTGAGTILAGGRALDYAAQTASERPPAATRITTIPLDRVLAKHDRVKLLKLDCEGSEFPILLTSRELHRVERIVGEVHEVTEALAERLSPASRVPGYSAYRVETLVGWLEAHGFEARARRSSPHLFILDACARRA